MNPTLRNRLIAAGAGGALAIAGVLGDWFEGTGPTVKVEQATLYKPYLDPVGVLTVCHGITGPEVRKDKLYSQAECTAMEAKHRAIAEAAVRRQITTYDRLDKWQQAALIDWTFNLGEAKLAGSTMRRKFNAGDFAGGCTELLRWVYGRQAGVQVELPGLVLRRDAEHEICSGGLN